jgi:hypothetical protein
MRFICLSFVVWLVSLAWLLAWSCRRRKNEKGRRVRNPAASVVRCSTWCYVVLVPRCRVRRLVVVAIAMNAGTAAGMLAFGRYPLVGSTSALPQRRRSEATRAERHERDTPGQATARSA